MKAFTFPGQGSQYTGMGAALAAVYPEAREVFQEVDDVLSHKLSALMWEGAESDLNLTENTQPALMAVSMAVWRVIQRQSDRELPQFVSYVAGHSLGEYAALAVAGTLTLADTARLLRLRGQAMQRAVPVGKGSMAAILGLDFDEVQKIANEVSAAESCEAANDNSFGQVVVSGHKGAVAAAIALAKERGAKRAIELTVSAPFHSILMAPAAEEMKDALADVLMKSPAVPLIANVTAKETRDPDEIRNLLVKQVTGTVRWRESVLFMKERGVRDLYELGAGKVLTGLTNRIDKDMGGSFIETPEQIENFLESFGV
jgi:[acyl-carrier-protein] S-malonyltransferase